MTTHCTTTETVPLPGGDEAVFLTCDLPPSHAGDHHWIES